MLDLFKDRNIEDENRFMLVNLILKRTKQISLLPYETPESKPSPQEIKKQVYEEIMDGKISGEVDETKDIEEKKELKEVTLVENPREHRTKIEKTKRKGRE